MAENKDFRNEHRTDWQKFLWNQFLEKIIKARSEKEIKEWLNRFFSHHEKKTITQRYAVMILIHEGKSYKEIGRVLWTSPATVSVIKKSYFGSPNHYQSQRSLKRVGPISAISQKTKKVWLGDFLEGIDLWELIKNPPRPVGMGLIRTARLNTLSRGKKQK